MSLAQRNYAGRNRDMQAIVQAGNIDRDTKAALVVGRYLLGTHEDDMRNDVDAAVALSKGIGRAALSGVANALRWGQREYRDYQQRRAEESAACEAASRAEQAAQAERVRLEQIRMEQLQRHIRAEKLAARHHFSRRQKRILRQRRSVLAAVRAHFNSRWNRARHFLQRKDVQQLGEALAVRGLRSLATHALLTCCTKGLGYHLAMSVDGANMAQQVQNAQDLHAIYSSVQGLSDSTHGLLVLDLMLDTFDGLSDLPWTDSSIIDLDDQLQSADTRYQALVDQNRIIEETAADHKQLLQNFPDAHVFEPEFGSTGDSRSDSKLIGPDNEQTTWDENGHLLDKSDHDHEIDPLTCTVKPEDLTPPPPPPPPADAPKS